MGQVKGAPITVLQNVAANKLSDIAVDCRDYNAINVRVFANGSPVGSIQIEGSDSAGGNYAAVDHPYYKRAITGDVNYNVDPIGDAWIKVRLLSYSAGSWTVVITPFVSPGSPNLNLQMYNAANVGATNPVHVTPGTGATFTLAAEKAEDAAHASGDTGVMALAVQKATPAGLGAEGDYEPLEVDANGRLHVSQSDIQKDDTDKLAVSVYGKLSAAGDTPIRVTADGTQHIAIVDPATATVADVGLHWLDGRSANDVTLSTDARLGLYNGASHDRARSIAASGAGLGVQQVGTLGELITLAASAARTESANGTAVTGLGWRNRYVVLFDVTNCDTDAGDTLDVYVDVSLDGSTWLNAIHFTQKGGTDAADQEFAVLDPSSPGTAVVKVSTDAASGAVRPSLFGPQMRARWAIVDAGTDDASFTFSVTAYAI